MIKVRPTLALILLALALAWPRAGTAQDVKTYTLDEMQRLAAGYYQAVGIARLQADQARQAERMAFGARLPTVVTQAVLTSNVITASLTFNDIKINLLPALDYNMTVSATQPIFTGFRLEKGQKQAQLAIDVARTGVGITVQDTVLAATKTYYAVLGLQDNVEISKRAVALTQQTLRTAESLYRAGEAVETSVLRARVAESDARRELLVAENALVVARHQLMLLSGVTGDFELTRPAATKPIDTPLDDLIAQGLAARPELKALALERQIAGLEIDRQRSQWYPTIEAQGVLKQKATFPRPSSRRLPSMPCGRFSMAAGAGRRWQPRGCSRARRRCAKSWSGARPPRRSAPRTLRCRRSTRASNCSRARSRWRSGTPTRQAKPTRPARRPTSTCSSRTTR
jgi:outer membrane protein TolC